MEPILSQLHKQQLYLPYTGFNIIFPKMPTSFSIAFCYTKFRSPYTICVCLNFSFLLAAVPCFVCTIQ